MTTTALTVDLDELRASVRGPVVVDGDPTYDERRRVWNGMYDRRPAAIVACTGVADVVAGIRFATSRGIDVAVRCGGHGITGSGTCDDGIVLDLSPMHAVHVDPGTRTVVVQGGTRLGQLDRETQAFGLAVPAGVVSDTGVGGLTLGGGVGWLMRKHGLTIDNLLACQVVTATGDVITASATEHPDLFWALRGGGGNFGIVTAFTFRAHEVGPTVLGGFALWPLERAAEVLPTVADIGQDAPDELGMMAVLGSAPPLPELPADLRGRPAISVAVCWTGPAADGERVLAGLRALDPALQMIGPLPFTALQSMGDATAPAGVRHYRKTGYLPDLRPEIVDVAIEHARSRTSDLSLIEIYLMGGQVPRVDEHDSAFGNRAGAYFFTAVGAWATPQEDAPGTAWVRRAAAAFAPFALDGGYVNFLADAGVDSVRQAYGASTYDRLAEVKRRYDPSNVFHLNGNVRPAHRGE
ncbi:FAD-binding oxidoreductase [Pseudonocardia sp. CA-107938]|uniref:FAD-binding oxidoreductase n=1 Tax=Pseudonocardia sp. CA-107938 TaxID=3240021 RepID=UPI003D8CDC38